MSNHSSPGSCMVQHTRTETVRWTEAGARPLTELMIHSSLFVPEACPFFLEVYGKACQPSLGVTRVDGGEPLVDAVVKSVLDEPSKTENIRGMKDLMLHRYDSGSRVTLVVENEVSAALIHGILNPPLFLHPSIQPPITCSSTYPFLVHIFAIHPSTYRPIHLNRCQTKI